MISPVTLVPGETVIHAPLHDVGELLQYLIFYTAQYPDSRAQTFIQSQ